MARGSSSLPGRTREAPLRRGFVVLDAQGARREAATGNRAYNSPMAPSRTADARARVATTVRRQARACEHLGSSLSAGLLRRTADDVDADGRAWHVLEP